MTISVNKNFGQTYLTVILISQSREYNVFTLSQLVVNCVIGNESVPIQLTQCRFPGLAISNTKILIYIFQIKYTETILSNSTRKLVWFEITKMMIACSLIKNIVSFIIIFGTFVPYT